MVGAAEALEIGLVARVVSSDDLANAAAELAAELAAGAPLGQRFAKEAVDAAFEMSFDEALAFESRAQAICLSSEDAMEGIGAFLAKRDPEFTGR
jgi:enoyl-CoA hydratase/carnithine racemase